MREYESSSNIIKAEEKGVIGIGGFLDEILEDSFCLLDISNIILGKIKGEHDMPSDEHFPRGSIMEKIKTAEWVIRHINNNIKEINNLL